MRIHTVKQGESIFSIARKYAIPPTKIIEHNELSEPDRLIPGQKLLILTPTRTHTVRGSDTIEGLALRYNVSVDSLFAANPGLLADRKCFTGKILSVKYDTPRYGLGIGNGFYYEGCTPERLMTLLPYMSYLTVSAGKWDKGNLKIKFKTDKPCTLALSMNKTPILRIFAPESAEDFISYADKFISTVPKSAKELGFNGISLAAFGLIESSRPCVDFLIRLKKQLLEYDMLLALELDLNKSSADSYNFAELADFVTLNYEKCFMKKIPDFKEAEARVFSEYAERSSAERSFIDLPVFAYSENEEISKKDAELLARRAGEEIVYDPDSMVCHFSYNKYFGGKRERKTVSYPSLENVSSRLDLIGRLGYMGASFDIMRVPLEYVLSFYASFGRTEIVAHRKKEGCLRE